MTTAPKPHTFKGYVCMTYPSCPVKTLLPGFIAQSTVSNPDRYYIIVPGPQQANNLDFPLVKPYIRPDLNLSQPLYHKGFIIMQTKHHGMPAKEIELDLFDFIGDGQIEHMTPNSIAKSGDIFKIFRACQLAPLMLDIVDHDLLYKFFRGKIALQPYNLLSHILNATPMKLPKAYIIHLECRPDRLRRMQARMEQHGLEYEIVEAIPKDEHYVTLKSLYADHVNQNPKFNRRAQFACYYSHLKAIRKFHESGEPMGFVFEDDAALRKDFSKRIPSVVSRLHHIGDFRMCSLIVTNEFFYKEYTHGRVTGHDSDTGVITHTSPEYTTLVKLDTRSWGMVGYIISREYAGECLERFDKPIMQCPYVPGMPGYVTSEVIPMYSQGWATVPAMVVDEMGPSNISDEGPAFHRQIYGFHGLDNFDIPENYD